MYLCIYLFIYLFVYLFYTRTPHTYQGSISFDGGFGCMEGLGSGLLDRFRYHLYGYGLGFKVRGPCLLNFQDGPVLNLTAPEQLSQTGGLQR